MATDSSAHKPSISIFRTSLDARPPVRVMFDRVAVPAAANTQYDNARLPAKLHPHVLRTDKFQTIRVLTWVDPADKGTFITGFLHESWPSGQFMTGWPDIRLLSHQRFTDEAAALALRDQLARGKTYSQIQKMFVGSPIISQDPFDVPFLRPAHWKEKTSRALVPVQH